MSRAVKITLIVAAIVIVGIISLWAFNTQTGSTGHDEGPPTALIMNH